MIDHITNCIDADFTRLLDFKTPPTAFEHEKISIKLSHKLNDRMTNTDDLLLILLHSPSFLVVLRFVALIFLVPTGNQRLKINQYIKFEDFVHIESGQKVFC